MLNHLQAFQLSLMFVSKAKTKTLKGAPFWYSWLDLNDKAGFKLKPKSTAAPVSKS